MNKIKFWLILIKIEILKFVTILKLDQFLLKINFFLIFDQIHIWVNYDQTKNLYIFDQNQDWLNFG